MKYLVSILILIHSGCQSSSTQIIKAINKTDVINPPTSTLRLNGDVESYEIYEYIGKNNSESKNKPRLIGKNIFKLDESNYLIEQILYHFEDEKPSTIWKFKYDGRLLTEIWLKNFNNEDNINYDFLQVKYEQIKDTIVEYFYRDQGRPPLISKSVYDESGKKIKILTDESVTELYYSKSDLLEKMLINYLDSNVTGKYSSPTVREYKYNKAGNVIEEKYFNPESSPPEQTFFYDYQYDKRNNWIKKIRYYSNGSIQVKERKIKYR